MCHFLLTSRVCHLVRSLLPLEALPASGPIWGSTPRDSLLLNMIQHSHLPSQCWQVLKDSSARSASVENTSCRGVFQLGRVCPQSSVLGDSLHNIKYCYKLPKNSQVTKQITFFFSHLIPQPILIMRTVPMALAGHLVRKQPLLIFRRICCHVVMTWMMFLWLSV